LAKCEGYKKSVRRDVIAEQFVTLRKGIEPPPHGFEVAHVLFKKIWDHRPLTNKDRAKARADEVIKIEREDQQCLDKIIVVAALEKRIRQHEEQQIIPATRKAAAERPVRRFEETVPTALQFLVDPCICGSLERWRHTE
jgi:hypothetical protein